MTLDDLATKLAEGLDQKKVAALRALAARLAKMDALEARRTVTAWMDNAALAELGIDEPMVAALARQLATARTMEHEGDPLDDVTASDPYASTRQMIASLGESDEAKRLQSGLDAAIAEDKEEP